MARAIKISSVSGALTVTITGPNGGTPTVYADSSFVNTQSMPATIADTATTSFWLPGPGKYTLSVKTSGGTEIAADNNSTRTVDLETDSSVAALNYDARTLATVSGDSGHSTAGSAASGSGLPSTFVTRTTTYTAAAGDFVLADGTSAGFTVTLPTAPTAGALVTVKKTDSTASVITVAPAGGGTIDGDANATITSPQFGGIFEHTGSNVWKVVAPTSSGGSNGVNGTNGSTVRSGAGAPSAGTGVDNDWYIDTTAHAIYGPKTAGAWGSSTSLIGPGGTINTIQAAGVAQTQRPNLNFAGSGVTVTDDSGNSRTTVTIPSGGIPPFMIHTGGYFTAPEAPSSNSFNPGTGFVVWVPIYVPQAFTATAIGIFCTAGTATAVVRLGIYNDDGTMRPGTLVLDAGQTAVMSTSGWQEITISQALSAGIYWLAAVQQVAAATCAGMSPTMVIPRVGTPGNNKVFAFAGNGGTTGALPSPAPAMNNTNELTSSNVPRIFLKAA